MPIVAGNDPVHLAAAARRLAQGGLVAFPTETVYGLGARADDDAAVARIYAAKGRPQDHPLIVHCADAQAAAWFAADLPQAAARLMQAFWPGPLTVIVPRHRSRAGAAAARLGTIALRMPAHPVALALLRAAAAEGVTGVAAPSANRFGRVSPTRAAHVREEFGDDLLVLDGGECAVGIESAIVDCSGAQPALLRPGAQDPRAIESVLGGPLAAGGAQSPRAPGTLESHYAPNAVVHLLDSAALSARVATPPPPAAGAVVGVYSRLAPAAGWLHRRMPDDAAAAAHDLYAVLREFDDLGVAAIWVEAPPPQPQWAGVADRLRRASAAAES
jgi:L-threonylcarbamoyladenylate synthase